MNPHSPYPTKGFPFFDKLRLPLCICLAGVLLSACTTVRQVQAADLAQLASLVQVGDTVTCTLRNGSTTTVKITSTEHDALVGENQRVPVADITRAEIKRADATKSVLLGLLVAAAVAAAASGGSGGGSGGGY